MDNMPDSVCLILMDKATYPERGINQMPSFLAASCILRKESAAAVLSLTLHITT